MPIVIRDLCTNTGEKLSKEREKLRLEWHSTQHTWNCSDNMEQPIYMIVQPSGGWQELVGRML